MSYYPFCFKRAYLVELSFKSIHLYSIVKRYFYDISSGFIDHKSDVPSESIGGFPREETIKLPDTNE